MGGKQKRGRGIRSQVLFETFNAFSPVDVKGGGEFAGSNLGDRFVEKQDSGDSAKVATLEDWKEEGKTTQAVSSTVRSVCRAPEQVAKAPKAASAIIIKATGTKAERRAPPACSGRVTRVIK